jgi:RNA polymerase sigma factor (sigma-70 family)
VEACLGGEEAAWRTLVERHAPLIFSIGRRSGLDEHENEDVFQDVFLHLFQQLRFLRDPQSLAKWLITTTYRCAWHARRARDCMALDGLDAPSADPPTELVEQWERRHLLRLALEQLDGRCQRVLATVFRPGPGSAMSYDEAALRLQLPRGSLGPTRARCLRKLARLLEEMGLNRS